MTYEGEKMKTQLKISRWSLPYTPTGKVIILRNSEEQIPVVLNLVA